MYVHLFDLHGFDFQIEILEVWNFYFRINQRVKLEVELEMITSDFGIWIRKCSSMFLKGFSICIKKTQTYFKFDLKFSIKFLFLNISGKSKRDSASK